jgi:hypothetical protein
MRTKIFLILLWNTFGIAPRWIIRKIINQNIGSHLIIFP